MTFAPRARSLTAFVKALTTLKLPSASSRARRISRMAALMSSSVSVPRPRTSASVLWSFSARESNIGSQRTPAGLLRHERSCEVVGVERTQVLDLLADPDQLHWDPEL